MAFLSFHMVPKRLPSSPTLSHKVTNSRSVVHLPRAATCAPKHKPLEIVSSSSVSVVPRARPGCRTAGRPAKCRGVRGLTETMPLSC